MSTTPAFTRSEPAPRSWGATPVFFAFLAMGFGDAVGPFVGLAQKTFHLSNFAAQWVAFTGFIMFGVLSVPMGIWQDRTGKRFVLRLGLAIMLASMLAPALAGLSSFAVFLLLVLLLGAGAAILQVAGNPLMRDVSTPGKYSRNLSLAQFVKAIGSMSGSLIPALAARWWGVSWQVIFPIYSVALGLTLLATLRLAGESRREPGHQAANLGSCLRLLRRGEVAVMVLGIFLYVGAEVSMSSGIPIFFWKHFGIHLTRTGLLGTGLFFLALTIGRFSGGVILNWMRPARFFLLTCLVSLAGFAGVWAARPAWAAVGFFVAGLGFANIFPLIFSITIEARPQDSNALAGLMVMAIVGGAFLPPLMGYVADRAGSMRIGFLVPLAAILYQLAIAIAARRSAPAQPAA